MKKQTSKGNGYAWIAGGLVGAALGVGAALLAESKAGKKMGKEVKHAASDFYKFMVPKLKQVKKMGEVEYKKFVEEAMKQYSKKKKLSAVEAKQLVKDAHATWKHLKRNL
jgi:gas vesicle protein